MSLQMHAGHCCKSKGTQEASAAILLKSNVPAPPPARLRERRGVNGPPSGDDHELASVQITLRTKYCAPNANHGHGLVGRRLLQLEEKTLAEHFSIPTPPSNSYA